MRAVVIDRQIETPRPRSSSSTEKLGNVLLTVFLTELFDEKMKRRWTILIVVACLGIIVFILIREKSPSIPDSAESALISLREPYTGDLIVEKTISDSSVIRAMAETFSSAKSSSDHKCSSIGHISFIAKSGTTTLKVLPGHNTSMYEFRLDGVMYRLARESYIEALVAAGIDRDDIRLDGHPDIEQVGADQSDADVESKSEKATPKEPSD